MLQGHTTQHNKIGQGPNTDSLTTCTKKQATTTHWSLCYSSTFWWTWEFYSSGTGNVE